MFDQAREFLGRNRGKQSLRPLALRVGETCVGGPVGTRFDATERRSLLQGGDGRDVVDVDRPGPALMSTGPRVGSHIGDREETSLVVFEHTPRSDRPKDNAVAPAHARATRGIRCPPQKACPRPVVRQRIGARPCPLQPVRHGRTIRRGNRGGPRGASLGRRSCRDRQGGGSVEDRRTDPLPLLQCAISDRRRTGLARCPGTAQSRSPALAGIIGARRACTALMISALAIPAGRST